MVYKYVQKPSYNSTYFLQYNQAIVSSISDVISLMKVVIDKKKNEYVKAQKSFSLRKTLGILKV